MTKFQLLLERLKKLNLPTDQFVIVGSGAMAIHGIRDVQDLDIAVTKELLEKLRERFGSKIENGIEKIQIGEDIESVGTGSSFTNAVQELIKTADIFDDIRYMNLNLLKKFKQEMGRPKDLQDLALIETFLAKQ